MNHQLNEMLHDRADAVSSQPFDVEAMLREGDKRVRRRRTAVVGGIAALGVTAVLAVPPLLASLPADERSTESRVASNVPASNLAGQPSWSTGSVIHFGDSTIDVGRPVHNYVVTDGGAVFFDEAGTVWSATDGEVTEVGHVTLGGANPLVSDGTRAAWMELADGVPTYSVLDQSTGDVVRDPLGNPTGMSDGSAGWAHIYALDGDVLYVLSDKGAVAWDAVTGETSVLDPKADGVTIVDVSNGLISYWPTDDSGCARIGTRLDRGTTLGECIEFSGLVSPDGSYVEGQAPRGGVRLYATSTGQEMPLDTHGYEIFYATQWLDNEHFVAVGHETPALRATLNDGSQMLDPREPTDLFTCSVTLGECTLYAQDIDAIDEWVALPGRANPFNSLDPNFEEQIEQDFLAALEKQPQTD